MKTTITVGKGKISIHDVWKVSHGQAKVRLSNHTIKKVSASRSVIESVVKSGKRIYGVNTGFGPKQTQRVGKKDLAKLQTNLIRSHSCSVGPLFSEPEVRAAMFVRLISNAKGYSGVRIIVLEKIVELLNKRITPVVPSLGSVGCSGDLSPLSHFILVLMGEGRAFFKGKNYSTKKLFKKLNIKPIILAEKEGLALNNGTSFMSAIAVLNLVSACNIIKTADIAGTMSLEAVRGFSAAFDKRVHQIRPHKGQGVSAYNFRNIIKGSTIVDEFKEIKKNADGVRVQDAYALRCFPQVHGAVRDTIKHCWDVVEKEINSVTDNPLVFPEDGEIISGGNFHGEPIAFVMDFLAIVLTDLGNISERRTARLVDDKLNSGLPACLSWADEGLSSGFMIPQYTAASLCNLNKTLSHPVSVDSIPTGSNSEDHVSFGANAANKCRDVIFNVENILAIELLCASQGLDFRLEEKEKKYHMGVGTKVAFSVIRKNVAKLQDDRIMSRDIVKIRELINSEKLIKTLNSSGIVLK